MRTLPVIALFLVINACTTKPEHAESLSARDATMKKYFQLLDSLPVRDTMGEKFKLLRAYYRNDTAYLNEEYSALKIYLQQGVRHPRACKDSAPLQRLGYQEAYRVSYWAAFCDRAIDITIGEKDSAYTLHVKIDSVDLITGACTTRQFTKPIKEWQWEAFKKNIYYVDVWGMQEQNDVTGVDGSGVIVYAYKKTSSNSFVIKAVDRFHPEHTALGIVLKTAFELSEVSGTCLNISIGQE
jgi:hypothetical protein